MAEARNTFTDSKMNQDIDARLMATDVYRTATNISISKSEGDGVGSLENVLGNTKLTDFGFVENLDTCNMQIIGHYMDLTTNNIILFFTNFADNSGDNLSNSATMANSQCHIGIYNTFTGSANLIVSGTFLNFSTTHPVYGVNMIEDILFWTDNRNQPRKINWRTALNDPTYYYNEDHISVSKYYPLETIHLIQEEIVAIALNIVDPTAGARFDYNATPANRPTTGGTGTGLTIDVVSTSGTPYNNPTGITISNPGYGYSNGDVVLLDGQSNLPITLTIQDVASMQDVVSPFLPDGTSTNPFYDNTWKGDKDFLKDKFVRFAYRFKFDDDEYSLISPFTQECFVPEQDGYFIGDDEDKTYQSSEVPFMINKINNIKLLIPGPLGYTTGSNINFNQLETEFKVKEIDIIYKVSNDVTLKVLDTLLVDSFNTVNNPFLSYIYKSEKPYKTLPAEALLRVYDQVPVRALAQEIAGNRIIYGNFVDKPTPPVSLNYEVSASEKGLGSDIKVRKEYQNHTLKQNRSYQAGVVLCDRYGRQSSTLLSTIDDIILPTGEKAQGSTFYHPYKSGVNGTTGGNGSFSYFSQTSSNGSSLLNTAGDTSTWAGDSLKVTFHDTITSTRNSTSGEPGLFSTINPLGWFTYKIVVKQSQQEYYNVYFPGLLNGYIDGDSKDPLAASAAEPVGHFALFGDNLSKVPRDLGLVGPVQTTFRTGRPSVKEDPSYYEFVDASGTVFSADPYTEEGERLLKTRDRERDIDSGSQINNASVKLYPRVLNYNQETGVPTYVIADNQSIAQQWYPNQNFDTVVTVGTGTELGLWSPAAVSPYNVAPVFYNYTTNPYIAKVELNPVSTSELTLMGVTGPSPEAGKLNFDIQGTVGDLAGTAQDDYKVGSKNLSTKPVATGAKQQGLLMNITCTLSGATRQTEEGDEGPIANFGYEIANENGELMIGWEAANDVYPYNESMQILGGNSQATVNIITDKERYPGRMVPRLSIYETKPIESKLDIYWETSTSGTVSQLNSDIVGGNVYLPVGFSWRSFFLREDMVSGTVVTDWFNPINADGTDLGVSATSENTYEILSVTTNESSVNIKNDFLIENGTGINGGKMRLKTNDLFYYGTSGLSFYFTLRVGVANDPSSGSAALLVADLSFTDILSNSAPYLDPVDHPNPQLYTLTQTQNPGSLLGYNGSADFTKWHDSIKWNIISQKDYLGNDVDYFTLPEIGLLAGNFPNTSTNNVGWLFMGNIIPPNPNYEVKIQLEDAGGRFSEIWTALITVTS